MNNNEPVTDLLNCCILTCYCLTNFRRFSVLLKYHKIYAVTMEIMHSLLLRIKALESLLPKDFSLADLQQDREDRSMEWVSGKMEGEEIM